MSAWFLYLSYSDGDLTLAWAIYTVAIWIVVVAVGAAGVWYTVTLPIIKRTKK
jgi:hypothetical protein